MRSDFTQTPCIYLVFPNQSNLCFKILYSPRLEFPKRCLHLTIQLTIYSVLWKWNFWGSKILKGKWAPKYEITKLHGLIYKCKYSKHNVKSIKDVISQAHIVEFHSKLILILRISFAFLSSLIYLASFSVNRNKMLQLEKTQFKVFH